MWYYYLIAIGIILGIAYLVFHKQITFFVVAITGKRRIQRNLYKSCKANDYLILNDLYFPVDGDHLRHIDTLIFGTKFIYVIKEVKQAGEIKIGMEDASWRVVYNKQLTHIENPILKNRRIISRILQVVPGIEERDIINMVVFTKTCKFDPINYNNKEFVLKENEVMKAIETIEKNIDIDVFDNDEVERYAKAFYNYGIKAEEKIKERKKQKNENDEFSD